jgi:hypothetical protein
MWGNAMSQYQQQMRIAITHVFDLEDEIYSDFAESPSDPATMYFVNLLAAYKTGLLHAGMRDTNTIRRFVVAYGDNWLFHVEATGAIA